MSDDISTFIEKTFKLGNLSVITAVRQFCVMKCGYGGRTWWLGGFV